MANSQGNEGRAARIYGAAAALRATVNSVIDPADQPAYRQIIDEIRAALTAEIFDAVWAEGKSIPVEQIIDYVLSDDNGRYPNQQNR
jgi:hypothetical protein